MISNRQLIEKRSRRIARNWLNRRGLLVRDLDPVVKDALADWSESRARLEIGDETGRADRWRVAQQNATSRRLDRLENALVAHPPLPRLPRRRRAEFARLRAAGVSEAEIEMRELLAQPAEEPDEDLAEELDEDTSEESADRSADALAVRLEQELPDWASLSSAERADLLRLLRLGQVEFDGDVARVDWGELDEEDADLLERLLTKAGAEDDEGAGE